MEHLIITNICVHLGILEFFGEKEIHHPCPCCIRWVLGAFVLVNLRELTVDYAWSLDVFEVFCHGPDIVLQTFFQIPALLDMVVSLQTSITVMNATVSLYIFFLGAGVSHFPIIQFAVELVELLSCLLILN